MKLKNICREFRDRFDVLRENEGCEDRQKMVGSFRLGEEVYVRGYRAPNNGTRWCSGQHSLTQGRYDLLVSSLARHFKQLSKMHAYQILKTIGTRRADNAEEWEDV